MKRIFLGVLMGLFLLCYVPVAFCQGYSLTVAVLVNSGNTTGYNTNSSSPGEFQRYPERYLEHLQVPYEVFDVSTQSPPADLSSRQLIIIGHKGVNPPTAWQTAITGAVNGGTGLVNLDWDPTIGTKQYMQTIFGAAGSSAGTPGTAITVPQEVAPGGSSPHYIAAMQRKFLGDPPGNFVYGFHVDQNGVLKTATSTVLTNASGTVLARIGSNPLIVAASYGLGRAVHFGTLDYLRADRFGFLMGIDDLFWRSLVWAARKPFVLRGYPRLWAVQMDDQNTGWGYRVRDIYDPTFTGSVAPDGTGGPWKLTGFVYTDNLPAGSAERASVAADIRQGLLKVAPHTFAGITYGNLYWNGSNGALTDTQWSTNLSQVLTWKQGLGGNDTIATSRSLVAHYWDLSNNTGYDLWNSLGIRYLTSIQKPGFQDNADVSINNGAERPHARPFWLYELPPKTVADEDYSFFFADDYPVNSRSGFSSKNFFLFATQMHDPGLSYPRPDAIWPSNSWNFAPADSISQFERYTWLFWSSLAPVQLFTHDYYNYESASSSDRQEVIREVSAWLADKGVRHVFMEELGDYIYSRTKSVLTDVQVSGNNISYTLTGNAATADGNSVATDVLVFFDNASEGVLQTLSGFVGGATYTLQLPQAPPVINSVTPPTGPVSGGTGITINGANFVDVTAVRIGDNPVTNLVVGSPIQITARTAPGLTGPADVVVVTASGMTTLANGFTYLGPPVIDSVTPEYGPQSGGTQITVKGRGFEPTSTVTVGGASATSVTFVDSTTLTATTPAGTPGPVGVTVGNSQGTTTLTGGFFYLSSSDTIHMDFTYANRSALLAAGWDFLARTSSGVSRNTEQTSGLVVSYDQTAHPGTIRIPVGPGDLWENTNDSQNTLFFNLPDNWNSIRLKIANFSPTADYQQVNLVAYQDDNNYVSVGRYYNSGLSYRQTVEFGAEDSGNYSAIDQRQAPSGQVIFLRMDRVPSSNVISVFSATDGITWTALSGSIAKSLVNPRLCVLVGANMTGTPPNADLAFVEIVAHSSTPPPTVSGITPGSGPTVGGTTVQVNGTGFIAGSTVKIGGASATGVVINSAASISAVTPAGVAGPADVVVINTNGAGILTGGFTYAAPSAPTVGSITPASGTTAGGTAVVINGTGFIAGSTVTIGGPSATGVVVNSATSISAVTPAGVAGPANVVVTNTNGAGILNGGFTYIVSPGTVLLSDDFSDGVADGWTISPLGNAAGWSVVNGAYTYDGGGHTQSYRGDAAWSDYTLQVDVTLSSLNNWPGGIRGRVNPDTGSSYTVWLYPASGEITLWRTTGWDIDSPGLTQLGTVGGIAFDTMNLHTVRMTFEGSTLSVYYDGVLVISATDAAYSSGLIALDVSNQTVGFDNVKVTFGTPVPPPTVSGITPASGPTVGGTAVQITGTGFITGSTVKIGGASATGIVVNSSTGISAVAPAGVAGPADVVVTNTNGIGTLTGGFTYAAPPTVGGITPPIGSTLGGTSVQISGTGFIAGSTVKIGGASATGVVVNSSTGISAVAPAGVAGPADVVVTNTNGTGTFTGGFTYMAPGAVLLSDDFSDGIADGWTISPLGNAEGWSVVAGVYTYNGGGHTQSYRGDAGWSDYTLQVDVTLSSLNNWPGGIRGRVNPDTGSSYTVWLYPASGEIGLWRTTGWAIDSPGLTQLGTVGGIAFDTMNLHTVRMTFAGSTLSVYYDGVLVISATDAAYSSGLIALDVSNQPVGFDNVKVTFGTPVPPPTVSGITPASGLTLGGTSVQISGSGFIAGSTVTIGGASATAVVVNSAASISAVTPPGVAGLADVVVTNVNGTGTLTGGFTYAAPPAAPTVTGISPSSGSTAGGTAVVITGTGFVAGTAVTIGGASATGVVVNSGTSISAVIPAGTAGTANVVVTNTNGTGTLTNGFTYVAPAGIAFVSSTGSTSDGASTTIVTPTGGMKVVGGNFLIAVVASAYGSSRAVSSVTDGINSFTYVTKSATTSNGGGDVEIWYKANTTANASATFTATFAGSVTYRRIAVLQYSGVNTTSPLDKSSTGSGTGTAQTVANVTTTSANELLVAAFSEWNTTSFTAGSSFASRYTGSDFGVLDRIVTATGTYPGGTVATTSNMQYMSAMATFIGGTLLPPTVTSISPSSGPTGGGTAVTITGTGFISGSTVRIGSTAATSVVVNSATSISAVSPAGTAGAADVVVTNTNGTGTLTGGFTYTAPAAPTVTGISPSSGSTGGGTAVTITGTGFISGSTVKIGGASATGVVVNSSTGISAVTPAGVAGPADVVVTSTNGTGTLSGGFIYMVSPGTVLLSDDFSDGVADGWTISPLGNAAGWSVVNGAYTYDGGGHTQSYRGDAAWSDYTLQVDVTLSSLNNWPGGIRGRVNPDTGSSYTVWLYPASGEIGLWRTTGWDIDSPGLTQLGTVGGIAFDTMNLHTVRMTFAGATISVYYDGVLVISATDAAYSSGLIALDVSNQTVNFDNVQVVYGETAIPVLISLSPATATTGGSAFTLAVNGSNFVSGSVVRWNGVNRTTTYISSSQLTAAISAADIAAAGTAQVTVFNPTGGATSNAQLFAINNPVPATTSLSPSSGTVGGAAFTLTVNGSGFINGSEVQWNGVSRTTTYVSSTQLTAAILAADIATVGTAQVTVFNPAPGGSTSNAQTFAINDTTSATAVTVLDAWTNLYSASPNNTGASNLAVGSFAVASGSQRLLLVSVVMEIGSAANPTISATYGGTALTQIRITANTRREIVWMGYLKEAQIGSGSKALTISYSGASGNVSALHVKWASYSGVNQSNPVASSAARNTSTASVTFGSTINYANKGMTVVVAGNGGTPATGTLTATPSFTAGTATTTNAQTSRTFTTAQHTAAGSYPSSTTVTWSGTTSSRSGLVVVSLQP